jgi:transcriptional regulator with XRE-family HTH domain
MVQKHRARPEDLPALYFYVGKRIREFREGCGMSQEDLAKGIGVARTTLIRFESGAQRIPLEVIYRAAILFKIRVDQLLPEANAKLLKTTEQAFLEFLAGNTSQEES